MESESRSRDSKEAGEVMLISDEDKRKIASIWRDEKNWLNPGTHAVAEEAELEKFEEKFGSIPREFRWFLSVCGGGGSEETIADIGMLAKFHEKYNLEMARGSWKGLHGAFIIGLDRGGNPFGIEATTGRVIVEDHDFGREVFEIAPSFFHFLMQQINSDPDT